MAKTFRQQFLALLQTAEDALSSDFAALAAQARARLLAATGIDGRISPQKWRALQQQIGALVYAYFVSDGMVFTVAADGMVTPYSPYARRLWAAITAATAGATDEQRALLSRALASAPDLLHQWQGATLSPFAALDLLPPDIQAAYREYVGQADVVRADQRVLADRVLNAAAQTQQKVAALLRELLAEQRSAQGTADVLDEYLTGSLRRRNKPYGVNARFDASRILSSESVFAHARAAKMAALLNPFITEVEIVLSPAHRDVDECDGMAAGSPYPVHQAPVPPFHSHCVCQMRFVVNGKTQSVIERLRGNPDLVRVKGALSADFAQMLLRGRPM